MKKTIAGIIFFLVQIGLAIFYNRTIDLVIVASVALMFFFYVLYNYFSKRYESCET